MYVTGGRPQVSSEKQVLLYLWMMGHEGGCYRDIADRFGLCLSTMFAVITRVGNFIMSLAPQVIRWPTPEEQHHTMEYYLEHRRFPGIVGVYYLTFNEK